jgi:restriction system protein
MTRVWIVRLGEGGELASLCREKGVIAIKSQRVGDLRTFPNRESLRQRIFEANPDRYSAPEKAGVTTGILWSFAHEMSEGDIVLSPKRETRKLLIGSVAGPYLYDPNIVSQDYPHIRTVNWRGEIHYDNVPREIWRSITAWQTLFELSSPEAVKAAQQLIEALQVGQTITSEPSTSADRREMLRVEGKMLFEDIERRSMDNLKDYFDTFSGQEFQEIVEATLKATGLHARSRRGPDQTIDIEAYENSLELGPRILVQVKHREEPVSGPEMQQFIGAMNREGDRGLYISTGGFTSAARRVAERSTKPITLMGWEDFIQLFLDVYDRLDNETKAKIPIRLVKILA